MARKDVYRAIDSERDYQDAKWGPLPERSHEVGAWLTVMRHCLNKAEAAWTPQPTDVDALKEIRQIAAVAVACMEQHGVACRTIDGQECVAPEQPMEKRMSEPKCECRIDEQELTTGELEHSIIQCPLCASAPALLAMLERLEWTPEYDDLPAYCTICERDKRLGHLEGCELAALLAAAKGGR